MKIDLPTPEQRQAANPATSVWVAANAGSGKTHVLVDRVIRLMLDGAEPETILCLTFTKAAAAEMQSRLFERLGQWTLASAADLETALGALGVRSPDAARLAMARQLFTRALETPGGLKIQTIHAFAEKLLKLFPVEAGIAPDFQVLEDRQSTDLLVAARDAVLRDARIEPESEVGEAMARVEPYCSAEQFDELLARLIGQRQAVTAAGDGDAEALRHLYFMACGLSRNDTVQSLRTQALALDRAAVEDAIARLMPLARHHDFHAGRALREIMTAADHETGLAALRRFACTEKLEPRADSRLIAKAASDANPGLREFLMATRDAVYAALSKCDLALRADASAALLFLAAATHRRYAAAKADLGLHDFDDLIGLASALLTLRDSAAWVQQKLDKRLTHILVDEAQDTSPAQWRIVQALSEEFFAGEGQHQGPPRTIFVVGDRKQSIYSFQGADVQSFEAVRTEFAARIRAGRQDFPDVALQLSYRSVQTVLSFVDVVFPARALAAMGFAADSAADDMAHTATRKEQGLVQLWPLVTASKDEAEPDPLGPVDEEAETSHRHRLARLIAQAISGWLGRRLLSGSDRPVRPGDIMVLFQRRSPLFDYLIAELRQAGVPVAGADRLKLRDSLAVMDLVMLAQAMLLPEDDHALACVLKSPLVPEALSDDELVALTVLRGDDSVWQGLARSASDRVTADLAYLQDLQSLRTRVGLYGFFSFVLARARKAMALRLGPEALDATDAFLDSVLDFEMQKSVSLPAFLNWFLADDNEIKREMDQGAGLVRLLTVHGSKGLEAPIVILADAADERAGRKAPLVPAPAGHAQQGLPLWKISKLVGSDLVDAWQDAADIGALAEHKRLLYVAMTRARDELYVCGSAAREPAPEESWYGFISAALREPHSLPEGGLIHLDGVEQPGMHYGLAHRWAAAADEPGSASATPAALFDAMPDEPLAAPETSLVPAKDADVVAALDRFRDDPKAALLLTPDCETGVDWVWRDENGALSTGRLERLAVAKDLVVGLLCDPAANDALRSASQALTSAYPGRRVMTGLLTVQAGVLEWFEDKGLSG